MDEVLELEQPPLTQVERITNTFVAPSKTFVDIRRNRSWWLPFLIVALFSYLFTGAVIKKVGLPALADHAMQQRAEQTGQQMTPEQMAQGKTVTMAIFKASFGAWPLIFLATTAVFSLLLWLGFNFILGGQGTFGRMFAVFVFASLTGLVKTVLMIAMLWFGSTDNFDIQDPVGTNPGYYLGPESAHWLKVFLGSFDVFTLWFIFLLGLGGAIVARTKVNSGIMLVFGAWILFVLVRVGFAAM
jgi:hypothetical protein